VLWIVSGHGWLHVVMMRARVVPQASELREPLCLPQGRFRIVKLLSPDCANLSSAERRGLADTALALGPSAIFWLQRRAYPNFLRRLRPL